MAETPQGQPNPSNYVSKSAVAPDLLVSSTQEESPKDLLTIPDQVSENIAGARHYAVQLAKVDAELGQDYEESYKRRYDSFSTMSLAQQEQTANDELRRLSSKLFVHKLNKMPIEMPAIDSSQLKQEPVDQSALEDAARQAYEEYKRVFNSNRPVDEQIRMGVMNLKDRTTYTEEDAIGIAKQYEYEAFAQLLEDAGLKPEDTLHYSQWGHKGWGQATGEFLKDMIPFHEVPGVTSFNEFADKYRAASPEQKIMMMPQLKAAVKAYAGSNANMMQEALRVLGEGGDLTETAIHSAEFSTLIDVPWMSRMAMNIARRGANAVASTLAHGTRKQAAQLVGSSLTTSSGTAAVGVTADEARLIADPFVSHTRSAFDYKGLTPEVIADIEKRRINITSKISQAMDGSAERSPLTMDEQEQFIRMRMAKIPNAATIESRDELGFTIKLTDGTTTSKIYYTRDGIGKLDGINPINALSKWLLSPSMRLTGAARKNLMAASQVELASEALGSHFGKLMNEVLELRFKDRILTGMSREEWQGVDHVLLQGDRMSKQFSATELLQGVSVENVGVVKLTDKQVAKYFEMRHLYDDLYNLRDAVYIKDLAFKNYRGISAMVDGNRIRMAGRQAFVHTDANGLSSVAIPSNVKRVAYLGKGGKLVGRDVEAKWVNDSGRSFVKLDKPVRILNSKTGAYEEFDHAFVRNKDLQDLSPGMLGYRSGYVPLYYQRVNYVVRQATRRLIDGVEVEGKAVRRFFDTREEAIKFADDSNAALRQQYGTDEKLFNQNKFEAVGDRELRAQQNKEADDYRQMIDNESVFNGQYFQARNAEPIKYGLAATESPRMNAIDSMNRYTRAMTWAYPQTAFRQRVVAEFQNTYGKYLVDPTDWRSTFKSDIELTIDKRNAIERYREDVKSWLSIRDEQESMFANFLRSVAEKSETGFTKSGFGKLSSGARESIRDTANISATAVIRSATHHAMLGMFNISQLVVQAMGATIAASVDPKNFAKALPRIPFLRAIAYMHPSEKGFEVAVKTLGKASGMSESEAIDMATLFHKTGLSRALRNTSADYNAAENGLTVTKGMLSRVSDAGLLFYREGELANRLNTFGIAYFRAKEMKAAGEATGSMLDTVMEQYYRVGFNLQRANRAQWQKGWLSVPTQYLQITAKYVEHMVPAMLGKKNAQWTTREAYQSLLLSTIMFGTVGGIPFGKHLTSGIRNWVTGKIEDGGMGVEGEDAKVAIEGGLTDLIFGQAFALGDGYASVSSRAGLASGVADFFERISDNPTIAEAVTGAFGSMTSRVWKVGNNVVRLISPYVVTDEELSWDAVTAAGSELGRAISSWDNIYKARLWSRNQAIIDSKGRKVAPLTSNDGEAIIGDIYDGRAFARALGFSPMDSNWAWELSKANMDDKQEMRDALDAVRYLQTRLLAGGTESEKNMYSINLRMIMNSLPQSKQAEFMKQVARMYQDESKLSRDLRALAERDEKDAETDPDVQTNPLVDQSTTEE